MLTPWGGGVQAKCGDLIKKWKFWSISWGWGRIHLSNVANKSPPTVLFITSGTHRTSSEHYFFANHLVHFNGYKFPWPLLSPAGALPRQPSISNLITSTAPRAKILAGRREFIFHTFQVECHKPDLTNLPACCVLP